MTLYTNNVYNFVHIHLHNCSDTLEVLKMKFLQKSSFYILLYQGSVFHNPTAGGHDDYLKKGTE